MPMPRLLVVAVPAVLLAGCAGAPVRQPDPMEVAATSEANFGGCVVGDVDPDHPGDEIVAVSGDGAVHLIAWNGSGWDHEVIYQCGGEQIQVAVGDANPDRPGNEIVTVGMETGAENPSGKGIVWVHGIESDGWWAEPALVADRLVHGVAVHDGGVVVAGFGNAAFWLTRGDKGWNYADIGQLPGDGKAVVDLGDSVAIGCTDGSLMRARPRQGVWRLNLMHKWGAGRSRLCANGGRILTANDDGALVLVGAGGQGETVHKETLKLRGAVMADLDGDPDLELATAGYGAQVVMLDRDPATGGWQQKVVYKDEQPFHHLASGDVYGDGTQVLVGCGFSGELVVLRP